MTYITNNILQNYNNTIGNHNDTHIISDTIEYYKGTGLTYTPPVNASKVIVECSLQIAAFPTYQVSWANSRLQYSTDSTDYEDGTWTSFPGTQMREGSESTAADNMLFFFTWVFVLSPWSGERKLRLAGRSDDSLSRFKVHRSITYTRSSINARSFISAYSLVQ